MSKLTAIEILKKHLESGHEEIEVSFHPASVAPLTKEQHEKLVKAIGYGERYSADHAYRFFHDETCGYFGKTGYSYLGKSFDVTREVTFDEIDFGERKVLHYESKPIPEWNCERSALWVKKNHSYLCGGYSLPASLVEAYFTPVYEKTIHLSEGDYTEEELLEKLKQVK